jgi:methionine aminopeptidase
MSQNMKTDEMPPFDINITFMNEHGNHATMNLYGVYILTEGQTMSIEDMITENTMQYLAMDIDLMDNKGLDSSNTRTNVWAGGKE